MHLWILFDLLDFGNILLFFIGLFSLGSVFLVIPIIICVACSPWAWGRWTEVGKKGDSEGMLFLLRKNVFILFFGLDQVNLIREVDSKLPSFSFLEKHSPHFSWQSNIPSAQYHFTISDSSFSNSGFSFNTQGCEDHFFLFVFVCFVLGWHWTKGRKSGWSFYS